MSHPSDLSYTNNAQQRAEDEGDALYNEGDQIAVQEETLQRAHAIIAVLQQRLNEDVARLIALQLDLFHIRRERQRPNQTLSIMEFNSPQPCFISHKIEKSSIRRVDFRIQSHDQGWVTHHDGGSWSWFDVCVLPKTASEISLGGNVSRTQPDKIWPLGEIETRGEVPPASAMHKDHEIAPLLTRERKLCNNSIASRDFEDHNISWSADSKDPEEAAWVRSLQPEERIVVRAWARYGGWSNHIRSISISLSYALKL